MKTDRSVRSALAITALALACICLLMVSNPPLSDGANDPSEVLKSLAGRWDGVTSGGSSFAWTIDEDGKYESVYRQAGKEVRVRGRVEINPEGALQWRSEDGQSGTLIRSGRGSSAQLLQGAVRGRPGTFQLTLVEARSLSAPRERSPDGKSAASGREGQSTEQSSVRDLQRQRLDREATEKRREQAASDTYDRTFAQFHTFGVGLVRDFVRNGLVLRSPTDRQISFANAGVNAATVPAPEPAVRARFENGTVVSIGVGMMGEFGRSILIAPEGYEDLFVFGMLVSRIDGRATSCEVGVAAGLPDSVGDAFVWRDSPRVKVKGWFVEYPCGTNVFDVNRARLQGMFDQALRAYLKR